MMNYHVPKPSKRARKLIKKLSSGRVASQKKRQHLSKLDPLSQVRVNHPQLIDGVMFAQFDHSHQDALLHLSPIQSGEGTQMLAEDAAPAKLRNAVTEEAASRAKILSSALSKKGKDRLSQIYEQAALESLDIRTNLSENGIASDHAIQELADLLAEATLLELDVLAGTDAQYIRYGTEVHSLLVTNPHHSLGDAAKRHLAASLQADFLGGGYFDKTHDAINNEQEILTNGSPSEQNELLDKARRAASRWQFSTVFGRSEPPPTASGPVTLGPEEITDFEARIYSSEHPVLGTEITAILEDHGIPLTRLGVNHCSVVAGIWTKTRRDVQRGNDRFIRYSEEGQWILANGSASWMLSEDELILKVSASFSSFDDALRWLMGVMPTNHGNRTAHRACSYSVGVYGINWVCHSNCNAFALRKGWADEIVDYPLMQLSFMTWGNYPFTNQQGHYGVSKKNCPIYGDNRPGGVPGAGLHYHLAPPYSMGDPTLAYALQLGMALTDGGAGFGLATYWDGSAYLPSGVQYNERVIPCPPPEIPDFDEPV